MRMLPELTVHSTYTITGLITGRVVEHDDRVYSGSLVPSFRSRLGNMMTQTGDLLTDPRWKVTCLFSCARKCLLRLSIISSVVFVATSWEGELESRIRSEQPVLPNSRVFSAGLPVSSFSSSLASSFSGQSSCSRLGGCARSKHELTSS